MNIYATGLDEPRELRAAPNGDIFLAETSKGEITVFRGIGKDGKAEQTSTFATGLHSLLASPSIHRGRIRSGFTSATQIL